MMQMRKLGNTGIEVSVIGLGTVKFGRNQGVKYPKAFELPTDRQIVTLLKQAKDLGITLLDTAPAYGTSEERLGPLIRNTRKHWVVVTKVGEEFQNGQSFYNFTPEHALMSIERSLKRLQTDFLDVVLVHSDGNDVHNIQHFGILEFLAEQKKKGIIRAFGMSTKTVKGGILALEKSDIAMVTYNPMNTEEKPVIEYAAKHQKGILIKKALASGHLDKISTSQGQDPIATTLQFILQETGVGSIILGTLNTKNLAHNVACIPSH